MPIHSINVKALLFALFLSVASTGCDPSDLNIQPVFKGRITSKNLPVGSIQTSLCARLKFKTENGIQEKTEALGPLQTDPAGYFSVAVSGKKKISQFILGAKKVDWLDYQVFLCAGRSFSAAFFPAEYPHQKPTLDEIMSGKIQIIPIQFRLEGLDLEIFKSAVMASSYPRNDDYENYLKLKGVELKPRFSPQQLGNFSRAFLYLDDRDSLLRH